MMATAVRKTFSDAGTRGPGKTTMPMAKAMSVAAGMAQPRRAVASPRLHSAYTSAGIAMPPSAATTGSMAWRRSASSPSMVSRLISSPTNRKNTAIHRSLTHTTAGLARVSQVPGLNSTGACTSAP